MLDLRRRQFITLLGGAAAWPLPARAQQAERMRLIGVLMHDLLPKAELIGLLVNPASPVAEPQIREVQAAAHVLGVRLTLPASPNSMPMRCS